MQRLRHDSFETRASLLLFLLALLNYWPMLVGRVPFPADVVFQFPPFETVRDRPFEMRPHAEMGDLVTEIYPWKAYTRRAALHTTFPLWNPHLLLGTTFAGDPQPALFYPPTLLYAVLPTPVAWSLHFLLRTLLAGLLAALLARELGAVEGAALVSGVIFAFCGWVTAFQTRPHLDSVTWLALALVAVDRLRRRLTGPTVVLTAVAFALPVLAGQPESAAHVTFVGVAFFLYRFALPAGAGCPGRPRFALAFAAAGMLAFALAAVQALPTLEFIGQLDRPLDLLWGPKPLREMAAFLSRDLGTPINSAGVPIPESAAYAGMLALLLAPLALLHRNRRDAIFFLALLVGVLSIVYGQGPIYWLSLRTPILRGMPNGRLLAVADLCLAVLAGLGLSALVEELRERGRVRRAHWILSAIAFAGAAAGILAIRIAGSVAYRPHAFLSFRTLRGPASSAAVLLTAGLFLALALAGRIPVRGLAALAVVFTAADLLTASFRFIPFSLAREIFPPAPTFDFLSRDSEPHRVASVDATYGAGFELVYGLDSATGFNVIPRRTLAMLTTLGSAQGVPRFRSERVAGSGRLLDLLNVKYLVATTWNRSAEILGSRPDRFRLVFSDASARVFENRTVLPRAFLVPMAGAEVLPSEAAQLSRVTALDFDPERAVILSEPAPIAFRGGTQPVMPPGVTGIAEGPNEIRMTAGVAEPSILVLSQTYYPGWKVYVDGVDRPLLRVDYGLAGAVLDPGTHIVRFAYQPPFVRLGAVTTAASLLICIGIVLLGRSREIASLRPRFSNVAESIELRPPGSRDHADG